MKYFPLYIVFFFACIFPLVAQIESQQAPTQIGALESSDNIGFYIVRSLDGDTSSNSISFESSNFPGQYLRHKDFWLRLDGNDSSNLFQLDSSFTVKKALNGGNGVSFKSANYPDRYIRVQTDNGLWIDKDDGTDERFKDNVTFKYHKFLDL
ncbi:family 43 glycosylhydrolase [Rhizophagus clarus]|uniref:non-reducing end alpha-L-arabinofuranosidase n=1 Tax=Rhizophagus clarus TaxID=94130 RepID=A0A8H3LXI1_9GLOM|nr:family 43 glycosylhydrolase [Rhizophagus clarus]